MSWCCNIHNTVSASYILFLKQKNFVLGRGVFPEPSQSSEITADVLPLTQTFTNKKTVRTVNPEEIGIELKHKLAFSTDLPPRPGEGTLGKRIRLVSNCFPLRVPSGNVYHYDVDIIKKKKETDICTDLVPGDSKRYKCLNTKKNREIISLMTSTSPLFNDTSFPAYDGQKNLYTRYPLQASFPIKCEVILPDESCDPENQKQDVYIVKIKPVMKENNSCAINLDMINFFYEQRTNKVPQEAIMALETILRHGPCLRFTPIGRSFFYPSRPNNINPIGDGLEIWFGYHQSIRLGQWGPMVNLNATATTFFLDGPVISYIANVLNVRVGDLRRMHYLPNSDIRKLNNKLKNLRIEVTHLKKYRRRYRILKLVKENAHRLEFEMTDNGRTVMKTVESYFRERYGITLQYPNLPCIQVHPENRKSYLPLEVCEILKGQHSKAKLEAKQNSEMIKFTAITPNERFEEIIKIVNSPEVRNEPTTQAFGLEVLQKPICLEGRVLDPPSLRFKDNSVVPVDGVWSMKQSGAKFFNGAVINSWVLLGFAHVDLSVLRDFSSQLVNMGKKTGITIDNPKYIDIFDVSKIDIKKLLQGMKERYTAELAVIVIKGNDKNVYGKIKQSAETIIGLATQCVKDSNIRDPKKCSQQYLNNLCQKINTKTGGINSTLLPQEIPDIFKKPAIVIGADVNHPGPSVGLKPSLAACIGSLDPKLARYAVSVRAQVNIDEKKQSVEIILDLKAMVRELLLAFYTNTKKLKPEKIIFYRDGVSEGQFETVRDHEVRCIRLACRSLQADYEPGLTFILVQKRHHTRFMPENPSHGVGPCKNVPPGTTVDTAVTDFKKFDFYLCSHLGLKGEFFLYFFIIVFVSFTPYHDLVKMTR